MKHISKQVKLMFAREHGDIDKLTIETFFNSIKSLPKDTVLMTVGKDWGKDVIYFEVYHDSFPESPVGTGQWELDAKLENGEFKVSWPESFKTIFRKSPIDEALDLWGYESPAVEVVKMPKCDHMWQATRFGAFKYCKVCNAVGENEHAQR